MSNKVIANIGSREFIDEDVLLNFDVNINGDTDGYLCFKRDGFHMHIERESLLDALRELAVTSTTWATNSQPGILELLKAIEAL